MRLHLHLLAQCTLGKCLGTLGKCLVLPLAPGLPFLVSAHMVCANCICEHRCVRAAHLACSTWFLLGLLGCLSSSHHLHTPSSVCLSSGLAVTSHGTLHTSTQLAPRPVCSCSVMCLHARTCWRGLHLPAPAIQQSLHVLCKPAAGGRPPLVLNHTSNRKCMSTCTRTCRTFTTLRHGLHHCCEPKAHRICT